MAQRVYMINLQCASISTGHFVKSLDFAISSAFSKIFCTKSQDIIDTCRMLFNCQPVAESLCTRKRDFLCKYVKSNNAICRLFVNDANEECAKLPGNSLACRPTYVY